MGTPAPVEERNRPSTPSRHTARIQRPAELGRWPSSLAPRHRHTSIPKRRATEHGDVAPARPATAASLSPFARIRDRMRSHSGYQGTPSQQALEAVAHIAYDRFR